MPSSISVLMDHEGTAVAQMNRTRSAWLMAAASRAVAVLTPGDTSSTPLPTGPIANAGTAKPLGHGEKPISSGWRDHIATTRELKMTRKDQGQYEPIDRL
jgi:hypothetical protein